MRVIFIFLLALVTTTQAQQINPVPDYIFRNQMSVGRNGVTDTAAYMSVGPRFGAVKGFMPPMVVDTNTVTGSKRNGLFIFSVQKNKYVYWDSVGAKWAEMAGTGGTAINSGDTAAMLLPYIRHAGYGLIKIVQALRVDTLNISTRAWRQKGIDSLASVRVGGTGTTNRSAKFTGTSTIGDGGIVDERTSEAVRITSNGNVGIGITANNPLGSGGTFRNLMVGNGAGYGAFQGVSTATANNSGLALFSGGTTGASGPFKSAAFMTIDLDSISSTNATGRFSFYVAQPAGQYLEAMRITSLGNIGIGNVAPSYKLDVSGTLRNTTGAAFATSSGNVLVGTTTDAGYKLDVAGTLRNTTGANFATSSGNVGIGLTSPQRKLHMNDTAFLNSVIIDTLNGLAFAQSRVVPRALMVRGISAYFNTTDAGGNITSIEFNNNRFGDSAFRTNDEVFQLVFRSKFRDNQTNWSTLDSSRLGQYKILYSKWGNNLPAARHQFLSRNNASSAVVYLDIDPVNGLTTSRTDFLTLGGTKTGDPTGGTAKFWKLGEAATVSPTSPNRTIRVEIDGVVYYIHAKTTND